METPEEIRAKDIIPHKTSFGPGDGFYGDGPQSFFMEADKLLELTAQNALAGNIAQGFVPNSTTTVAGQLYVYGGVLYEAKDAYQGVWDASKFIAVSVADVFAKVNKVSKIAYTDDGYYNSFFVYLYIDVSGYTGSADVSSIGLRSIQRAYEGNRWGFVVNDANNNPLFSVEETSEFAYIEKTYDGIKVRCVVNWDFIAEGAWKNIDTGSGKVVKFTSFANHDILSPAAEADKVSKIAYTDDGYYNSFFVYLYIDVSGYTGSADVSSIGLRSIQRAYNGNRWGFVVNDADNNPLFSVEETSEFAYIEKTYSGIKVQCVVNWNFIAEGAWKNIDTGSGKVVKFTSFVNYGILSSFFDFGEKINKTVYTEDERINNLLMYLYIDASKYTGSGDVSSIYIRTISNGNGGLYGIAFNDANGNVLAYIWESQKPKFIEYRTTDGLYFKAIIDFEKIAPNSTISGPWLLTSAAYYDLLPRFDRLAGKVWYACGDSFTVGDWNTYTADDKYIPSGIYSGRHSNYPYLVGNSTGLIVKNIALGGSSISTTVVDRNFTGGDSATPTTGLIYNIGDDADFITLKYGINDEGHGCPLGTIDDTGKDTFYGAWNWTMNYLITNFPKAHIGIIITNGITGSTDFQDAMVEIAKKWGVPYLDEDGGVNCPTLHHTSARNPACAAVKALRNAQQAISWSNSHPTPNGFKFEATIIENFLRML